MIPDRTKPPLIKDAVNFDIHLPPYQLYKLNNGVPVYYINDGTEDVAVVEFVFKAGNNFENKPFVSVATNALLKNGTPTKTAFQITKIFEYYGAHISCRAHHDTATITLHCLSKYLRIILPLIREIITEANFPQYELDIFQQNQIQRIAVNLKKCDFVAGRIFDEILYGAQHPYGRVYGKEDITNLNRDDLNQFFKEYYLNGQCKIFSAGRFPADFESMINENFGDLNIGEKTLPLSFPVKSADQKKYRILNDPEGVQGAIRIGRPFPNRTHPDFKKAIVLNVLFGGYFGSRLMANIREEKGYTYGIHSFLQNHLDASSWMISTEAGKDVCEATITEVYYEMELLRNEPPDEEELLLVKNYIMGLNLGYLDGPFNVISQWKSLILNNLDEEYFNDTIQQIKQVTAEELQSLAIKYLNPDEFFELVVI
ncbi:MAG: pitrilysin family protein [Ginsengibacter sp.]